MLTRLRLTSALHSQHPQQCLQQTTRSSLLPSAALFSHTNHRCLQHFSSAASSSSATPPPSFTPRLSSSSSIRSSFLNYFTHQHSHHHLPSSSLIPSSTDDTLLFTNAGMVQLKEMLSGNESPPKGSEGRLVSVQKCLRAGGKHNDLENVGYTARHHTFFEMLGNFSIGSYFKEQAISYAWQYLTVELGIPKEKLRVSVHHSDDEAAQIWTKLTGFTEGTTQDSRIIRLGDADNFWSMGDQPGTPCGPCSEIFYDQGTEVDGDRWLEIWNLVFMQYTRGAIDARTGESKLIPLAKPCVDTGMGLERLAAVLQHVPTNYDTDFLRPLIMHTRELALQRSGRNSSELTYTNGLDTAAHITALKVIVDHLRSASFLISAGVIPSNIGRGYVLRRIIRRAVKYGTNIGLDRPFLYELFPHLVASLGEAYPELRERGDTIQATLRQEETTFFTTLSRGMKVLDDAFTKQRHLHVSSSTQQLSGDIAFLLYDSFGFPLDLTQIIARERGLAVDVTKFDTLMKQQKEQSKGTGFHHTAATTAPTNKSSSTANSSSTPLVPLPIPAEVKRWQIDSIQTEFTGFTHLSGTAKVLAVHSQPNTNTSWLALSPSPFYANSGGQVGDVGTLTLENGSVLRVVDCVRPYEGCSVVRIADDVAEQIKVGTQVNAQVDVAHRTSVAIHHTATHLLHAALKQVLGSNTKPDAAHGKKSSSTPTLTAASINQAGSLVAPDRLRFDFSCPAAITPPQLLAIEEWINNAILSTATHSDAVNTDVMSKDAAIAQGATAMFGEKYSDTVRVVTIPGFTSELCGGTHVRSVRSLYPFKVLSESSIASGIRRIEAVAGPAAFRLLDASHASLKRLAAEMKVTSDSLPQAINKMTQRVKEYEEEVKKLKANALLNNSAKSGSAGANATVQEIEMNHDGKVFKLKIHEIAPELALTAGVIRDSCTSLLSSDPSSYHILLSSSTGSIGIAAGFKQSSSDTAITAKQIWQRIDAACVADHPTQQQKPKGGGSEKIAQGVLPREYQNSPQRTLRERIVATLGTK